MTDTNTATTPATETAKTKTPKVTPPEVTLGATKFGELLSSHWDAVVISGPEGVDRDRTERAFSLALTAYLKGKGLITRGGREKSYDETNVLNAIMVAFLTQAKTPTDQLQLATVTYAAIEVLKVGFADMDKARRAVQSTLISDASPFYAKRAGESKFSGTVVGLKDPAKLPTKPSVLSWEHKDDAPAPVAAALVPTPVAAAPKAEEKKPTNGGKPAKK